MIPASRFKRFIAYIIDAIILGIFSWIVLIIIAIGASKINELDIFMLNFSLIFYPVLWLYYAFFESSLWQASLGKRLLKIYVSDLDNQKINFATAFTRAFLWILPLLPIAILQITSTSMEDYHAKLSTYWWLSLICGIIYIIEFIPVFFTKERWTLYDIFTSTRVNKKITGN